MESPEVYQRDFDEALNRYLARKYPGVDLDDCDERFDPGFREDFTTSWPKEAQELSRKYNLVPLWDPDCDEPPYPVASHAARDIRCQDDRIWVNQIQKDSIINLPPHNVRGRFLIIEIDLSKPRKEIEADLMALVDIRRKKIKVSGPHHELVDPPEPRDRDKSYIFKPMEVWKMVEEKGGINGINKNSEAKILSQLAKELCQQEGWDRSYGNFEDDPDTEDKVKAKRKALKNAYKRDKELYYGRLF